MAKQKLLSEQARLKDRGAAEMVLLLLTTCKGIQSEVAEVTLQLGISILTGGNVDVQTVCIKTALALPAAAFNFGYCLCLLGNVGLLEREERRRVFQQHRRLHAVV